MNNRQSRILELDGLRGFAILSVFIFHACSTSTPQFRACCRVENLTLPTRVFVHLVDWGWVGVDLFFVLSGFLITDILLEARDSSNYFSVFYLRRAIRIFPVYYLNLIFFFLIQPLLPDKLQLAGRYGWRDQIWYWLNLSNFPSAFHPLRVGLLTQYWTLAIEEQFYLVWPWVVRRFSRRRLLQISIGGIALATFLRNLGIVRHLNMVYDNFIYRLTPFRVDSLLFGALLAIAVQSGLTRERSRIWIGGTLVAGSVLVTIAVLQGEGPANSRYIFTGLELIASGLILLCTLWSGYRVVGIFRLSALRAFGRYSYCIYATHLFLIVLVQRFTGHFLHYRNPFPAHPFAWLVVMALIDLGVCFGFARLSWAFIEGPALSLKRFIRYQRSPVREGLLGEAPQ